MIGRALQVLIKPGLLGLGVALLMGFGLAEFWQAVVVDEQYLTESLYARGRQSVTFMSQTMNSMREEMVTILLVVAGIVWITAIAWFLVCWSKRIAEVGEVRCLRARWRSVCFIGMVVSVLVAGYLAYPQLWGAMTLRALLYMLLFLVGFYGVIYYAVTVVGTHRVYVSAIPWSKWRPW